MPQEKIKVEKTCPNAVIPKKQSLGAAGYDICTIESGIINSKFRATIRTGLIYKLPHSVIGIVYGRSGLALKNGLDVVNSYIKPDVHEELVISVVNNGNVPFVYECGHRIAQLVFLVCASEEMINSEGLESTTRGSSGFGSTGVE